MGQHFGSELLALVEVWIARKDESANTHFFVALNLAHDLID
jgi:hypothetical protein